ncbi:hypothetical protein [Salegentibacter holothuriorum]|uniref:hypothetical protein n=1 Tax=Salegentibacter holothuriorum TaxID=241145 RepID=UPI0015906C19|nr:hypothetical protein [Salegentibacter holothuriorum]
MERLILSAKIQVGVPVENVLVIMGGVKFGMGRGNMITTEVVQKKILAIPYRKFKYGLF